MSMLPQRSDDLAHLLRFQTHLSWLLFEQFKHFTSHEPNAAYCMDDKGHQKYMQGSRFWWRCAEKLAQGGPQGSDRFPAGKVRDHGHGGYNEPSGCYGYGGCYGCFSNYGYSGYNESFRTSSSSRSS